MKIKKLSEISYEALKKRHKSISKSTFNTSDGKVDIVQVTATNVSKGSGTTSDLYVFKNNQLIARDVTRKTKDGNIRKIEIDVLEDGYETIIEESSPNLKNPIKRTYGKIITTIGEVRKQRDGGVLMNMLDKLLGLKINKKAPVIITIKTSTKAGEKGFETPYYTVLAKGKSNKIKLEGTEKASCAMLTDNHNKIIGQTLNITNLGAPDEFLVMNKVFNHFFKKNKGFQ